MAKHRTYSIEFKRRVAQEYIAGETVHALAKRHDLSRNLIRIWVAKYEADAFEDSARARYILGIASAGTIHSPGKNGREKARSSDCDVIDACRATSSSAAGAAAGCGSSSDAGRATTRSTSRITFSSKCGWP
jgi:transposase